MPKYVFYVWAVVATKVEIEAANEDEAREKICDEKNYLTLADEVGDRNAELVFEEEEE